MIPKFINTKNVDCSWLPMLEQAFLAIDPHYLQDLEKSSNWLPGPDQLLAAFSLPRSELRYILFGESPYPRPGSANGYAFWDASVDTLWSERGFSKAVNRATSLRNLMKTLLLARGDLKPENLSQSVIALLDKKNYVQTIEALFKNFIRAGFLLLNASLVWHDKTSVRKDAKEWQPFVETLLKHIKIQNTDPPQLILWGKIAEKIKIFNERLGFEEKISEHPYQLSFITSLKNQLFFRELDLLSCSKPAIYIQRG